jgi:hypothetical protein
MSLRTGRTSHSSQSAGKGARLWLNSLLAYWNMGEMSVFQSQSEHWFDAILA